MLKNYWPMSNLNDLVGDANLLDGLNYSFVSDRFNNPNSAIYFNNGYLKIPSGLYLTGDFTVTFWLQIKLYKRWAHIFEFGNEFNIIRFQLKNNNRLLACIHTETYSLLPSINGADLKSNVWYHLALVLRSNKGYIYINGDKIVEGQLNIPENVTTTENYIGGGDETGKLNPNAIYDDLKIYDGAMKSTEIRDDFLRTRVQLTNYWPMSTLNDLVGKSNLYGGSNYSFVSDRFDNPNSALYFNNGYLQVQPGVFFNGDFTVTLWLQLKSYENWTNLFEFGSNNNKVYLQIIHSQLVAGINFLSISSQIETPPIIELNFWYHLAFVLENETGYIYVDGSQTAFNKLNKPMYVNRRINKIGDYNTKTNIIYDDLKIYEGAMLPEQILDDCNKNKNPCKYIKKNQDKFLF